jgi:hypothetical protein
MSFWEDRAPEIGILDENESGEIYGEIPSYVNQNHRTVSWISPLSDEMRLEYRILVDMKGKILGNGTLDKSKSDWICVETLVAPVDSIHGPYNLFPLNPSVTPWISLLNDEMMILWMIWGKILVGNTYHPCTPERISASKMLDQRILDGSKNAEVFGEILDDSTHCSYHCNLEMISALNQI